MADIRARLQGNQNPALKRRLKEIGTYNQTHRNGEPIGKFNASHVAGESFGGPVAAQRDPSIEVRPNMQGVNRNQAQPGQLSGWLMAALKKRNDLAPPPTKPPDPGENPLATPMPAGPPTMYPQGSDAIVYPQSPPRGAPPVYPLRRPKR